MDSRRYESDELDVCRSESVRDGCVLYSPFGRPAVRLQMLRDMMPISVLYDRFRNDSSRRVRVFPICDSAHQLAIIS